MDVFDLQVNCHVSLRSQQASVMFYQEPTRDVHWDSWTASPMANFSSISNFGLNPMLEMECHRNRQVNSGKGFYASQDNYQGYYSSESQFELPSMSSATNDHWSSYNYAFHPYGYHGYSHHDPVDVLQQSPLLLPSQQYYPSWHVPYSRESNPSYYEQMYQSATRRDFPDDSNRTFQESNNHVSPASVGNSHTLSMPLSSGEQEKSFHHTQNLEPGQTSSGQGIEHQPQKHTSLPHPEPLKYGQCNYHASNSVSVDNFTQYCETHDHTLTEGTGNFPKTDSRKFLPEKTESVSSLTRMSKLPSMPPVSNHVKKQEKKMKRMLRELQKSEPQKAMQLLDFYHFHVTQVRKNSHSERSEINSIGDRDLQVLHLIQQVQQRMATFGYKSAEHHSRKPVFGDELRKTRLLPKHAVKTLESWFEDNLSNPYPSRDQTLHLALDCSLTIEQVRKWFANKRNRSRNNKLYK